MTETAQTIRELSTDHDYAQCLELQYETWGSDFNESVPPAIVMLMQKVGGVAAGAFHDDGRMLGFVLGFSGYRDGRPVHWSHMLAVSPAARGQGIGRSLKLFQRDFVLANGIDTINWTYDPLVAKNANINFNQLAVRVSRYVVNFYGDGSANELHRGLGTDRFIVDWCLRDETVERVLGGDDPSVALRDLDAPIVSAQVDGAGRPHPAELPLPSDPNVRVEIPWDIHAAKLHGPDAGERWRAVTRRAFLEYLERGYSVRGFYADATVQRCFYVLQP